MGIVWLIITIVGGYEFNLLASLPEGSAPYFFGCSLFTADMDNDGWDELFTNHESGMQYHYWIAWEYRPENQYAKIEGPEWKEDTSISVMDRGDSDRDGLSEFLVNFFVRIGGDSSKFICGPAILESKDSHSFPSSRVWWDPDSGTGYTGIYSYPIRFTDLDQDGRIEILGFRKYAMDTLHPTELCIYENRGDNDYEEVFSTFFIPKYLSDYPNNYVFGDFDGDGKMEWSLAITPYKTTDESYPTTQIWECVGNDDYRKVFEEHRDWINGFESWLGNDADGDGKPEIFVKTGGYGSHPGVVLNMYEATEDNTYKFVSIDTIWGDYWGAGSISTCGDVDGDGKEEVILSIGTKVIIYKAVGDDKYEKVWKWKNDLGTIYHYNEAAVICHDFNKNSYDELIITNRDATKVFEIDTTSSGITTNLSISQSSNPIIFPILPNPFKSVISIKYQVARKEPISLEVYDAMGRLVRTLLRTQNLEPGIYKLRWDGKDDKGEEIPPGIYFLELKAKDCRITRKLILIR